MTTLPLDNNQEPIQVLRLKASGGAHAISTTTGASARNATALSSATRVVSVYATQDVYIRFGDSSVTAASTDHFFPANVYYDFAIGAEGETQFTHLAARSVSASGTVYISEKE